MGQLRRVGVTGLGMVSPIACGVGTPWRRLLASESAIARVDNFDVSGLPCKVAAQVPRGDAPDAFNPDDWMDPKEQRRVDDFIVYGMSAATQALRDADWAPKTYEEEVETGILFGSGIGGLGGIYDASITLHEKGPRRISPFFIPGRLFNLLSGQVSIAHSLKGPNHAVVTACSTGAHAIGDAGRLIELGDANVMLAGGAESAVNRISLAGFCACRALSTGFNDRPKQASRPYDRDRDGFVMGEGAGCVVLEEYEHAKARGARIYAELVGYGLSGDAYHITAPSEDGSGAQRAMKAALKRAGLNTDQIDYVNAHGTSTMADVIELGAVKKTFGQDAYKLSMSSTKSATGHLLGAAGAIEAIYAIKSVIEQAVPPTLNLDEPDEGCDIDLVPKQAKQRKVRYALSNSFGFGGTNAALIFGAV